jgi:hypothetical protein
MGGRLAASSASVAHVGGVLVECHDGWALWFPHHSHAGGVLVECHDGWALWFAPSARRLEVAEAGSMTFILPRPVGQRVGLAVRQGSPAGFHVRRSRACARLSATHHPRVTERLFLRGAMLAASRGSPRRSLTGADRVMRSEPSTATRRTCTMPALAPGSSTDPTSCAIAISWRTAKRANVACDPDLIGRDDTKATSSKQWRSIPKRPACDRVGVDEPRDHHRPIVRSPTVPSCRIYRRTRGDQARRRPQARTRPMALGSHSFRHGGSSNF